MMPIVDILKSAIFRIIGITIAVILLIVIGVTFIGGCMTLKLEWRDDLPPECNIAREDKMFYYRSKDKSASVIGMEYCYKCLHRIRCQKEVFGVNEDGNPNPVNYNDPMLFRDYKQCLDELK